MNDNKDKDFTIDIEDPEVKDRKSEVSAGFIRKKAGIIILIIICIFTVYYFFISPGKKETKSTENQPKAEKIINPESAKIPAKSIAQNTESPVLLAPKLPELPKIDELPIPPKPIEKKKAKIEPIMPRQPIIPIEKSITQPKAIIATGSKSISDKSEPMVFISGSASADVGDRVSNIISDPSQLLNPKKLNEFKDALTNQNSGKIEDTELKRTSAGQTVATYVGNLEYTIAQGKVIDAILETAIDTSLVGQIRAIVSRDVFSESGNRVLVSKGSRLIGSYQKTSSAYQSRVDIGWQRIILPTGIDVNLSSQPFPGIDQLGRVGVGGMLDAKISNIITNSAMLTSIKFGIGILTDKLSKDKVTISQGSGTTAGTTKTTGSAGSLLMMDAAKDASNALTNYVNKMADLTPSVKVNQGTRLKVFVAKDIIFPKDAFKNYEIIN